MREVFVSLGQGLYFERCSQLFLCINVPPKKSLRAPAARGLKKEMGTDLWLMCVCVCSQWKRVMRRSVNEKPTQAWCHKFLGKKHASLAWHLESVGYFQWGFAGLRYQALLRVFKTHLILDEHWFTLWNPTVRQAAICPSSWRNGSQQCSLPSLGKCGSRTRFDLITRGKKMLSTCSAIDLFSWYWWITEFIEQPDLQLPICNGEISSNGSNLTALWTRTWFWLLTIFYMNFKVLLIFNISFTRPQ